MKLFKSLKISLLIGLIFSLSACSVFKHSTKSAEKSDLSVDAKAEEKTVIDASKDTKAKTVTTLESDSLIKIPGKDFNFVAPQPAVGKPLKFENDDIAVKIVIDSGGFVTVTPVIKPKIVPIHIKKTIVRDEDIKEKKIIKSDSSGSEKLQAKSSSIQNDKSVTKIGLPWWLWLIVILSALGYLAWHYRAKLFL